MQKWHLKKLTEHVHNDTLAQEVADAVEYCVNTITRDDWVLARGKAAECATPATVHTKLNSAGGPDSVIFGGALGMLDLQDRVKPFPILDVGRMRWACEALDQEGKIGKVLDQVAVRSQFDASALTFSMLRRVERDADIDVVCLSLYWHKPGIDAAEHPLKEMCRDIVFSAQRVGQGLDLEIERFKRTQDEEKKRRAMGKTAWRVAVDLHDMVKLAEPQRNGQSDAELLAKILATRKELQKEWVVDTCRRYLQIASKMDHECQKIMNRWEVAFQREALLDAFRNLRAAATACPTAAEFATLLETLFYEQTCKMRRSVAPKGRGHDTDATQIFRGIILRHVFFKYLRQIFPRLADSIAEFGTWMWYHRKYGMTETGRLSQELAGDSDDEPDTPAKGLCPEQDEPSRFPSKMKLIKVCEAVATGKHDWGFTSLAKLMGNATTLDLGAEPMRTLQSKVQEIWSDYVADFPENPRNQPASMPSTTIEEGQHASGSDGTAPTVRATSAILTEEEYQARLATWMRECAQSVENSVNDYIGSMISMVVTGYDTVKIEQKLKRIPIMNEAGRKLFAYDSFCRDPLNWANIKKHKRSHLAGAKVLMEMSQAGDESADTLAVVKNIYMAFRTERTSDHLSEDIVACLVPGSAADSPDNPILSVAWKSLKALGNKHHGPKIGILRFNQTDLLSHIYTRGTWNRAPDHHIVFTYQATPQTSQGRKRMRYLKDNETMGDTYFNQWPVPMYQLSQMPKVTMNEHDAIFADDTAVDEGGEDGAGAAMMQDLGEKVVPFPREFQVKLWQEMIHVWDVDVGVMFQVGAGQCLLAYVLERKRAVGIMKNKAHKDFVHANLALAVKSLGLAPDRRPAKPSDIATWEASRTRPGGNPPPVQQTTLAPAPNAIPVLGTVIPPPSTAAAKASMGPATLPMPSPASSSPTAAAPPTDSPAQALAAFGSSALR